MTRIFAFPRRRPAILREIDASANTTEARG